MRISRSSESKKHSWRITNWHLTFKFQKQKREAAASLFC
jgi:hypothetical protein